LHCFNLITTPHYLQACSIPTAPDSDIVITCSHRIHMMMQKMFTFTVLLPMSSFSFFVLWYIKHISLFHHNNDCTLYSDSTGKSAVDIFIYQLKLVDTVLSILGTTNKYKQTILFQKLLLDIYLVVVLVMTIFDPCAMWVKNPFRQKYYVDPCRHEINYSGS
jgi:hypothetical protein